MPNEWSMNWIKPLHENGDINNANNYSTIMVGSIIEKPFGDIMESMISEWAKTKVEKEHMDKLDIVSLHHNTIDHLVTLPV